jgi:hypothetical protein
MNVTSVAVANAKRTRRYIMAYLEGDQNLNWISDTIRSSGDMDSARAFIAEMNGYGDEGRYQKLVRWLESQA